MSELEEIRRRVRNIWGAISSNQVIDKDVEGQAKRLLDYIDELRRAPSPSPAPGVTEKWAADREMLAEAAADTSLSDGAVRALCLAKVGEVTQEVRDWAALAALSQSVEKEERPVSYHDWLLSTSLSQPAKGEGEGSERSQGHYDRDGYCDNPARGY